MVGGGLFLFQQLEHEGLPRSEVPRLLAQRVRQERAEYAARLILSASQPRRPRADRPTMAISRETRQSEAERYRVARLMPCWTRA